MRNKTAFSITGRASRPSALTRAVASACLLVAAPSWAFNSGSTGVDGALNPAVNTEIQLPASGILNYTSINIPEGVTVKFKKNALNTPIYLLASGNVNISGMINIAGTQGAPTGTAGDGIQADDGLPGVGGPGGFDGGRGGRDDQAGTLSIIRGGSGLGPGGGRGGTEGADGCLSDSGRYYKYVGGAAGHLTSGFDYIAGGCASRIDVGNAYGSAILQPLIGGSGGGGGLGGTNYPGSGGGGGGGAILIAASGTFTLASTGSINASGGYGGEISGTGAKGPGGAGSGGSVRIVATTVAGSGGVTANFGCTAASTLFLPDYYCTSYNYNKSSQGRIRIEGDAITYTGTTTPSYVADVPGPVFISSLPLLRIASVAGTTVPANPTGNADVVLPANVSNPVTINLVTTNVPTGNTVMVKVIPAYGNVQEVLSPAITGSNASGNTSVSVSLPQGPSILQAITSFTVTVAMGESLSRFAQNERVEKVEIIAGTGKTDSAARLITISGKSFDVPTSILQMVGFNG